MEYMKHLLYIILFAILTSGCNYKQKKIKEQERLDSIAKIEKEMQDSIEKIRIDSLASIAWGDAKFGMSIKEALNTNAFKGSDVSNVENGKILLLPDEKKNIGNTNIDVMHFDALFKMDELCHIFIRSYPQPADHINDLENDAINIASKFEKKYGKPTESLDRKVSITDFNKDEPICLKRWNFGYDKTIYINLCEETSGYEYYYEVSIASWKHPIKKDIEKEKKEVQKQKEREILEEYQF